MEQTTALVKPTDSSLRAQWNAGSSTIFFGGIALRFVEAGGGFGLAEDIGDAVIADAVAGAEVGMRVVVEGAPADAAGVLRIGGELVVNARVAKGVLALALIVVGGLGGEGVADELGVEIAGMIRRFQGKSEVVHGEDIFEKLGLLEVANAAGLARSRRGRGRGRWCGCRSRGRHGDSLMRTPQRMMEG